MKRIKRIFCLFFAVALLLCFAPQPALAAPSVCFTAVNDTVLDLNDETMPFWSGMRLYVAYTAVDGTDLGISYNPSRDKQTLVLYKARSVLIFDLAARTITDNSGQTYSGTALLRGGVIFIPIDVLCRFFGLQYSYTRISYGYLVRIKSASVVLSDEVFIDAASATMAQRYAQYLRAREPVTEEPAAQTPVTPPETVTPPAVTSPDPPAVIEPRTAYLAVGVTDAALSAALLPTLSANDSRAAFLFSEEMLLSSGDLLRRLAAGGQTIALRVDASGGTERTLGAIERANRALWLAANCKSRLIYLAGASDETLRAVSGEGYCPLRFAVDYGSGMPAVSRASARILSAADRNGGSCRVYLGTDAAVSDALGALLRTLRAGNCTMARLTEVAAQPSM